MLLTADNLVFCLRKTRPAARYMTELSDVVAGEVNAGLHFEFLPLEQNAKLLVANLRAFLKSDLVGACEHGRWNNERDLLCFLPHSRDGKIKTAAILCAFKTQIADVLLRLFHKSPDYT